MKPLPAPAIRTTTRLIQVGVLVHDKHGTPVADLTKDDFTILDERQPQTIQIFPVETNLPSPQPPALAPDTFTNRINARADAPPNVTIIHLDGLNTEVTDQDYARKQVIKFLGQIQPQDRVGLYVLGQHLNILHDFTADSTALLAALDKYKTRVTPELTASTPHELAINPPVPPGMDPNLFDSFLSFPAQREANLNTTNRVLMTVEVFEEISNRTGGRAFYNTNLIYSAIRSAVDDSRITYELGYYPTNTAGGGKFHETKVMVNRPGVNVRARKGYFAVPEPKSTPSTEKAALSVAAASPLESTTIGLTVKVSAADVPGAEEMKTVMHFDAREIPFHQEDGRWKAKIETVYVQLDHNAKILNAPSKTYDLNFTPDRY